MQKVVWSGISGFALGVTLSQCIALGISFVIGNGNFYYVSPSLVDMMGNELMASLLQTVLSGCLGAIFALSSFIYDRENWSLLRRSAVHFAITESSLMLTAYLLGWLGKSLFSVLIFLFIALVVYCGIWFASWMSTYVAIKKLNDKLEE